LCRVADPPGQSNPPGRDSLRRSRRQRAGLRAAQPLYPGTRDRPCAIPMRRDIPSCPRRSQSGVDALRVGVGIGLVQVAKGLTHGPKGRNGREAGDCLPNRSRATLHPPEHSITPTLLSVSSPTPTPLVPKSISSLTDCPDPKVAPMPLGSSSSD